MENGNKIRSVLLHEFSIMAYVVVAVFSFIMFVYKPILDIQNDIDVILNNHLPHIQEDIDEIKSENKELDEAVIEINLKLTEILMIINKSSL